VGSQSVCDSIADRLQRIVAVRLNMTKMRVNSTSLSYVLGDAVVHQPQNFFFQTNFRGDGIVLFTASTGLSRIMSCHDLHSNIPFSYLVGRKLDFSGNLHNEYTPPALVFDVSTRHQNFCNFCTV
jgi:hypothetical protein